MDIVHVRFDRNHMATTFAFTISCGAERAAHASRALAEAHAEVARLERELSEFTPVSPTHQLNSAAPGERVRLGPEAIELIERSERFRELTDGAFNCAAKSALPCDPSLGWDAASGEAWRLGPGVRIGFGAIGKGYALDRARALIERAGFNDYLLSSGGSSIVLSGFAAPGDAWTFGWSWKKDAEGDSVGVPIEHASGRAIALGISGTHEKGQHILRVGGGQGAPQTAPHSTFVAASSAADADALSTALFVAGFERGLGWNAPTPVALAQIDSDETPRWNGIFQQAFGAIGGAASAMSVAVATAAAIGATALASASARADDVPELHESLNQHLLMHSSELQPGEDIAAKSKSAGRSPAATAAGTVPGKGAKHSKAATNTPTKKGAIAAKPAAEKPKPPAAPAPVAKSAVPRPATPAATAPVAGATSPSGGTAASSVPAAASATAAPEGVPASGTNAAAAPAAGTPPSSDGEIDLGSDEMGANKFNPYVSERAPAWGLLPVFALAIVLVHLKKVRRVSVKKNSVSVIIASAILWSTLEQAQAVELVPMGKSIMAMIGTKDATKKTFPGTTAIYDKKANGKPKVVAFVEKNTWQTTCAHTWIVGIGADGKVTQVVAQEQQCPHAKPAAAASFLEQYKGKGPADTAKLKDNVTTIAKATGSCELATEAVVHAITTYQKVKGTL